MDGGTKDLLLPLEQYRYLLRILSHVKEAVEQLALIRCLSVALVSCLGHGRPCDV